MSYAFWSGGKDSILLLHRAQQSSLAVTHLVKATPAATEDGNDAAEHVCVWSFAIGA
jgi:diphthamide synthase (EF-2-diphthine--ammonia ligase)